jgi:integrase/recombinase XerD
MKTLEVFDKYTRTHNLSWESGKIYNRVLKHLIEFNLTEYPTSAFEFYEFISWAQKIKHLSISTVNLYIRIIKGLNNLLCSEFDYPESINKKLKTIKSEPEERRIFTPETLALIMSSCQNDFERLLISALIDSICRIGELASLKHDDIEPEEARFKSTGKTSKRKQYHRCDTRLCNAMLNMSQPGDFVFPIALRIDKNLPLPIILNHRSHALHNKVNRIMKRAGLTGVKLGPHTIRHSGATLVAKETDSILIVQSLLAHSSQAMSQRYIHDVQKELSQKVSPLQLLKDKLADSNPNSQYTQSNLLTSGETPNTQTLRAVSIIQDNTIDQIIDSSYPDITDAMKVRPLLNANDLKLIRRAFVCLAQFGQVTTDPSESRKLFHRFLRKEKKEKERDLTPAPQTTP